jgi:hypothetical protein
MQIDDDARVYTANLRGQVKYTYYNGDIPAQTVLDIQDYFDQRGVYFFPYDTAPSRESLLVAATQVVEGRDELVGVALLQTPPYFRDGSNGFTLMPRQVIVTELAIADGAPNDVANGIYSEILERERDVVALVSSDLSGDTQAEWYERHGFENTGVSTPEGDLYELKSSDRQLVRSVAIAWDSRSQGSKGATAKKQLGKDGTLRISGVTFKIGAPPPMPAVERDGIPNELISYARSNDEARELEQLRTAPQISFELETPKVSAAKVLSAMESASHTKAKSEFEFSSSIFSH